MTRPALFVDPDWQDAAIENAKKGYPWAVWGTRDGIPLGLHASCKTKEEAEAIAARQRKSLRPKGSWKIIVTNESEGSQ